MKRNLVLVNLTLLGIAILLGYALLGKWRQFEAEHRLDLPNPGSRAAAGHSQGPASPASASVSRLSSTIISSIPIEATTFPGSLWPNLRKCCGPCRS